MATERRHFLKALAAVAAKKLRGTSPYLITVIQTRVGAAMLAPFVAFSGIPQTGGQWAGLVTIGVVHTGLMYVLLYGAIQRLPTGITASLSFIYPVAAVAVAAVVVAVVVAAATAVAVAAAWSQNPTSKIIR